MAKISIVGSGTVGSIVGKGLLKLGHQVIFYDINAKVIERLRKEKLTATLDLRYAFENSDITFITVPTPTDENGKINLTLINDACQKLGALLKEKSGYHLFVVKSTVVPTTTEKIVKSVLEKASGKKCGIDFGLCVNPEFLTEIHHTWTNDESFKRDFFSEERIVIGEFDKKSGDILEEIYKPLGKPIFRVDLRTAEMIKYA